MTIEIAQSPPGGKPESGLSFGDAADGVAAVAGATAALFALLSLRQVQRLARATRLRESRAATLNLLASGGASLGHQSQPLGTSVADRAARLAVRLAPAGAWPPAALLATVLEGRFLDPGFPDDPASLRAMADWYEAMPKPQREDVIGYLNRLEETCTSILRATLDFRTLDKMYGTLIRETYREAAQAIYLHRRTGSYRYYDQLEHVVDRLERSAAQMFGLPGLLRRLGWLRSGRLRRLGRELARLAPQERIDGGQLETALLESGLLEREDYVRSALEWRSDRLTLRKVPPQRFARWRGLPADTRRHQVMKDDDSVVAEVIDWPIGVAPVRVTLAGTNVRLDRILSRLPREVFHPDHLFTRVAGGGFTGQPSVFVCSLPASTRLDADHVRPVLRVLKRELNSGRLRPFVVVAEGTPTEAATIQPVLYSEGGILLHVQNGEGRKAALWLF